MQPTRQQNFFLSTNIAHTQKKRSNRQAGWAPPSVIGVTILSLPVAIPPNPAALPDARHVRQKTMSSATESLAQKWLRQNVQSYAFKDAVYAHVDTVLSRFSTVRPKTDVYSSVFPILRYL